MELVANDSVCTYLAHHYLDTVSSLLYAYIISLHHLFFGRCVKS